MLRRQPLVVGETYHVYNRGAHKQSIFTNKEDYDRFSLLLYLSNSKKPVYLRELLEKYRGRSSADIFLGEKGGDRLVEVLSYCLMPNHFHLIVRQKEENGISIFMKKLATAYSMYFNTKYGHSGTLFQGRFKSSHVGTESYFRYIFAYVHLNPLDIFQPDWKEIGIKDVGRTRDFLTNYPYTSLSDYPESSRPQRAILATEDIPDFLKTHNDMEELLAWHAAEDGPLQHGILDTGDKK